jgi:hypothetical protein
MPSNPSFLTTPTLAIAAALSAAAAWACGGAPEQPDPRHVIGCHFFVQDDAAAALGLPWGVRLLDQPLEGWPNLADTGARLATTLTGQDERDHPFGYWIRTADDSVRIGYPAGGGIVLDLALENGAFEGVARPVGDLLQPPAALPDRSPRPVRMVWARCPD